LFGHQVRAFHDPGAPIGDPAALKAVGALGRRAAAESLGTDPGPVHINLPLREPLVPTSAGEPGEAAPSDRPEAEPRERQAALGFVPPITLPLDLRERLVGRGLIYCGPDAPRPGFPEALWRCAAALGLPVLADPLSEVRFGPGPALIGTGIGTGTGAIRIARYKCIVRNPKAAQALKPDWVLRFGRAPISRTVLEWLEGVPTLLVDPARRWADPSHELAQPRSLHLAADPRALCEALAADPPRPADPAWCDLWRRAEGRAAALAQIYLDEAPWCEAQVILDLLDRLPPGDGLLCGNSLPIRQMETWAGSREAPLRLFGNRGASGIDGQLSTLAGLNAAGIPTTGLLGDLSFLHDLSGLLLGGRLDRPCVVLNNGGGRIFDYLPQAGLPDFERLWRTPRPLDLGALAGVFGLRHRRVCEAAAWGEALGDELRRCRCGESGGLIEVAVDAESSQEVHLGFRRRLADADLLD
ncbi:MAG: 2-succinyl-5-enolpyruvyl-6-hydroxy-3-cyclohexene-1-carboxylate synthase, partial [Bdellovibrio bacteriovorus]